MSQSLGNGYGLACIGTLITSFVLVNETYGQNNASQLARAKTVDGPQKSFTNSTRLESLNEAGVCNFHGGLLRVAVSPQPPFVDCSQDLMGDWDCKGSNIEVIHVLQRRMNFRISWIVLANDHQEHHTQQKSQRLETLAKRRKVGTTNGSWSEQNPTDSKASKELKQFETDGYLPIFRLLARGRVLLSANGVMATMDRLNHSNLIVSEAFDSFKLHFLLSKSVRDHDHIFVKPFTLNAWLAILASAAIMVPIFYLINTTSSHYDLEYDRQLRSCGLSEILKFVVARLKAFLARFHLIDRRSSSGSSSLVERLDKEIDRINILAKNQPLFNDILRGSGGPNHRRILTALDYANGPSLMRGEKRRRLRLLRRKWLLERNRLRRLSRKRRLEEGSGFSNIAYIVWYVVASLACQGGETEDLPKASSTRILVAFWWLYLIVIFAIHSGVLTAILTFPKQNDFIQTLDDYLNLEPSERASLRLSVDKYSELAHLLTNPDSLHRSPLEQLIESKEESVEDHLDEVTRRINFVNFQRHRQRVLDEIQQGRGALMEERSTIRQIISQEYFDSRQTKCLFKSSRYPIDVVPMSLIMSSRMPKSCVNLINLTLRRISKTGLAEKWRRKYESHGNDCLNSVIINAGDVDKIELRHVVMAFWLLLVGLSIGLISLIGEIVWLFLTDDEEDHRDEDCSSSSSSSLSESSSSNSSFSPDSSDSDQPRLAFRKARAMERLQTDRQAEWMRSMQRTDKERAKKIIKRTKRQRKRLGSKQPKIVLSLASDAGSESHKDEKEEQETGRENSEGSGQQVVEVDESELVGLSAELRARRAQERRRKRLLRVAQKKYRRLQKTRDFLKRLNEGRIYTEAIRQRMRRMSASISGHFDGKRVAPNETAGQVAQTGAHYVTTGTVRRRIAGGRARVAPS